MICNAFEGYRWTPDEEEFIASLMRGVVARERRLPPQQSSDRVSIRTPEGQAAREHVLALLAKGPHIARELVKDSGVEMEQFRTVLGTMRKNGEIVGEETNGRGSPMVWSLP